MITRVVLTWQRTIKRLSVNWPCVLLFVLELQGGMKKAEIVNAFMIQDIAVCSY